MRDNLATYCDAQSVELQAHCHDNMMHGPQRLIKHRDNFT
jgi:hypothetical protein